MHLLCRGMKQTDMLKYGALFVLVLQNSTLVLTMRYSRSQEGQLYIASTAVVMSELTKLMVALVLIGLEENSIVGLRNKLYLDMVCQPVEFAKLVIPACLYTLQSNLLYVAVSNLDAVTYQVLYQLKILTTAMFSVLLLRRHLHLVQWLSLLVLLGGIALVQVSGLEATGSGDDATAALAGTRATLSTKGLAAVMLACCSSGCAGVYFEKVLKSSEVSLWVRNVELALIGIVAGLGGVWYSDAKAVGTQGFFRRLLALGVVRHWPAGPRWYCGGARGQVYRQCAQGVCHGHLHRGLLFGLTCVLRGGPAFTSVCFRGGNCNGCHSHVQYQQSIGHVLLLLIPQQQQGFVL